MNPFIRETAVSVTAIPVIYILLRLVFKKSIMFKLAAITVYFTVWVAYTAKISVHFGGIYAIISPVSNIVLGFMVYSYINKMLTRPLIKTTMQLETVSQGNLSIDIAKINNKNELGLLNKSMLHLRDALTKVTSHIKTHSNGLLIMGNEINLSSEEFAQHTAEHAKSIEQVSSTMEEIAANSASNVENARQTEKESQKALESIYEVLDKSKEAVAANRKIFEKINVINEISFQTNLLALNASIEAARAGEQGKGFSVVATEVGKLSEGTNKAAEEIVAIVRSGMQVAETSGKLVEEVVPEIEKTLELVQKIMNSSVEQNSGIEQVNNAMQKMNRVLQKDASFSESLASNAEKLVLQAEELQQMISYFKIV